MFGALEAILSIIRSQIGLKSDKGDYAGSVHAKLALLNGDITGLFGSLRPGTSDITISSNTAWDPGVYRYNNFTVNAGVTLSANGQGLVIIANNIIVSGLISASGRGSAGGASVSPPSGTYQKANGNPGIDVTSIGGAGGGGGAIDYRGSSGGSDIECVGGRGGNTAVANGSQSNTNGGYTPGAGGSGVGIITNLNWVNAFSYLLCGAGGGSGAAARGDNSSDTAVSGAGGAGGGFIVLVAKSITINSGGAVRADGLAGSNGNAGTYSAAAGGGGGGGGTVVMSCAYLTNNGAVSASGGSGGSGVQGSSFGSDYYIGNGGAGGSGVVLISQW